MSFFQKRKIRKTLKQLIHQAKTFRSGHEDVMNEGELAYLGEKLLLARSALKEKEGDRMEGAAEELDECLTRLDPPKKMAGLRENFDVLVVAISVAMAFRAYFYQPFKIPTGSMQPTLYGIHTCSLPASEAGWSDHQPFLFLKWLVTGESFKIIRSQASGTISISASDQSRKPGYTPIVVAGLPHYVPNDVIVQDPQTRTLSLAGTGLKIGDSIRAGEVIWSGKVVSGDFVFVNRWIWNFRHPRRGEVMVFSTTGIRGLPPGTHYIKRMTGLPGETLQIQPPNLLVNGQVVTEPERIGLIAGRGKLAEWAPAYAGFNPNNTGYRYSGPGTLSTPSSKVTLTPSQYYAMGDNSFNSYDSRYWGPVPERNLLGPATKVYWPFTSPRFGSIE